MQNCKMQSTTNSESNLTDYIPSDSESEYMSEKQLDFFKNLLLKTREEVLLSSIKCLESIREESKNLPDENDLASAESSLAVTIKIRENSTDLIAKIDAALKKIENHEYGYCEESGDEIGLNRLKVSPLAQYSLDVQATKERNARRMWDNDNFLGSDD
jgi:DnaK suppressor protein